VACVAEEIFQFNLVNSVILRLRRRLRRWCWHWLCWLWLTNKAGRLIWLGVLGRKINFASTGLLTFPGHVLWRDSMGVRPNPWRENSRRFEVETWTLAKRRLSNERRNSILMTSHHPDLGSTFWLVVPRGNFLSTNQKDNQDLDRDTSSVWNFCARYSDVVLRGLNWRPCETSAVFSGYVCPRLGL